MTLQQLIEWHKAQQENKQFHAEAVKCLEYFVVDTQWSEEEFCKAVTKVIPRLGY